jgi:flagellar basal-body rod protein FlgF
MDNPGYISLTRMKGLADELRVVANNIANVATTGFRAERLVFAEVLVEAETDGGSLSMAAPRAHFTDPSPGGFHATGGTFDFAIEGEGFFQVQTPNGPRLTRAGSFIRDAEGMVMTMEGNALLDAGGGPVQVPMDAQHIAVGTDGTISADGQPIGQIGLFVAPPETLMREEGVRFRATGPLVPAPDARVAQGYLESSNVSPVAELSRMIEVQRTYELGQSFLDLEDQRVRDAVRTLGRSA